MINKLIASIIVCFATLPVFADSAKPVQFSPDQSIFLWTIDNPQSSFDTANNRPDLFIIYNKKVRVGSNVPSDSVRVNCNDTPVIVAPGSSFACYVPVKGKLIVSSEPGFYVNGSEGIIVDAGDVH
jgi:hypothetical protein